jgi:hypothetical protein
VPRDKGCDHEGQEHGGTRVVGRNLQEPAEQQETPVIGMWECGEQ